MLSALFSALAMLRIRPMGSGTAAAPTTGAGSAGQGCPIMLVEIWICAGPGRPEVIAAKARSRTSPSFLGSVTVSEWQSVCTIAPWSGSSCRRPQPLPSVSLRPSPDTTSIGTLSAFVLVSIGVVILRRTRPDLKRSFRVPFSPVLPIASALLCFYLMLNLTTLTWVRFAVWLVLGVAIYFAYGYRHSRLRDRSSARET